VWSWSTPGIRGISIHTGEEIQWTKGSGDRSPLWLSDGTGFYYLHATGIELGHGAGPKHALAHYDIMTGEQKILSFDGVVLTGLSRIEASLHITVSMMSLA
jgi:hypothetical protein